MQQHATAVAAEVARIVRSNCDLVFYADIKQKSQILLLSIYPCIITLRRGSCFVSLHMVTRTALETSSNVISVKRTPGFHCSAVHSLG